MLLLSLPQLNCPTGTYDWKGDLDMRPNVFVLWNITGVPTANTPTPARRRRELAWTELALNAGSSSGSHGDGNRHQHRRRIAVSSTLTASNNNDNSAVWQCSKHPAAAAGSDSRTAEEMTVRMLRQRASQMRELSCLCKAA